MAAPVVSWALTDHARIEMARRGIDFCLVEAVLAAPEQRFSVRPGRDVLQSRFIIDQIHYVIRVFVDVDRTPADVVTVYRSSKIGKYWRSTS